MKMHKLISSSSFHRASILLCSSIAIYPLPSCTHRLIAQSPHEFPAQRPLEHVLGCLAQPSRACSRRIAQVFSNDQRTMGWTQRIQTTWVEQNAVQPCLPALHHALLEIAWGMACTVTFHAHPLSHRCISTHQSSCAVPSTSSRQPFPDRGRTCIRTSQIRGIRPGPAHQIARAAMHRR